MSFVKKTNEEGLKKYDKLIAKIEISAIIIISIGALALFIAACLFSEYIYGVFGLGSLFIGLCVDLIFERIRSAISKERSSRKREQTREMLTSNKVVRIKLEKFNLTPGDKSVKNQILAKVLNEAKVEAEYNKEDNSIVLTFRFTDNSFTITVDEKNLIDYIKFN